MRSREYDKRISIYQSVAASDGYGGSTVINELVGSVWAKLITPKKTQRLVEMGVTDVANTVIFRVRQNEDIDYNPINQYITHNSVNYVIHSVINEGFKDVDIEIVAVKEATTSVTEA